MPSRYRATVPRPMLDLTRRVTDACKRSGDPALVKCGQFFDAITCSKITISAGTIEIMDLAEPYRASALGSAVLLLADVWFDVAAGCKNDLPSLESKLHPIRERLTQQASRHPEQKENAQ